MRIISLLLETVFFSVHLISFLIKSLQSSLIKLSLTSLAFEFSPSIFSALLCNFVKKIGGANVSSKDDVRINVNVKINNVKIN